MGVVNPEVLYMAGSAGARVTRRRGQGLRDFSEGMGNIAKVLSAKRAKYDALKAEFPDGIDREFINEDVRAQLTSYVTSEKEAFIGAKKYLDTFKGLPYIFNLGHGLLPETDPDKVNKLIKFYREY